MVASFAGVVCGNCYKMWIETHNSKYEESGEEKMVFFLDGTAYKYCETCGYNNLSDTIWKKEINGEIYHKHFKRDYWHKINTKHELRENEFLNLEDWKKRRFEKPKPKIITPEMKIRKEIRSWQNCLRWQKKQLEKRPDFYVEKNMEDMKLAMQSVRDNIEMFKTQLKQISEVE